MSASPPPPSGFTPPPVPRRAGTGWLVGIAVAVVVALLATALAAVQTVRLRRARADVTALQQQTTELQQQIDRLRAAGGGNAGGTDGGSGGTLDDLLNGLLGGSDGQSLDQLLNGLLGDGGGALGDLFGDTNPLALAACVGTPGGGDTALPNDEAAAIRTIADQVATQRQLQFTDPIEPQLLSPQALADRVVTLTERDYTPAEAALDARLLTALGAIPPGTDLRQTTLDLLGEQVAGFYDPDTGELVAGQTGEFDPAARITLAHELDHALTDQALGLPDLGGFDGRSDAGLAASTLIEGDATLLMQRWAMAHLSLADQLAGATSGLGADTSMAGVPYVLQRQLLFPYLTGLDFVCSRFRDGGWAAVDRVYETLPTTTAQVIWPDRYAAGEAAVDVADAGSPGAGWERLRTDTLGAADLWWLFEAPGDDPSRALDDPKGRAAAWAGGRVAVYGDGNDTAVYVGLAQRAGEPDLCDSVTTWYQQAFPAAAAVTTTGDERLAVDGPTQDAVVRCAGDEVRVGIAPDVAAARALTAR